MKKPTSTTKTVTTTVTTTVTEQDTSITEIIAVIDRSGSMSAIRDDSIGAFNTFIEEQQKLGSDARLTVVLFDDKYEVLQERVLISEAVKFDTSNFIPRGMTALYDGIGRTVNRFNSLKAEGKVGDKVIVLVLTDGGENSSKEYNAASVHKLISESQKSNGWEFVFLAANQDAFATSSQLGINASSTMNFAATGDGVRSASAAMSDYTTNYRSK